MGWHRHPTDDREVEAAGRRLMAIRTEQAKECKYCIEGPPEWSEDAKCWIHRRPTLDKRCTRKIAERCEGK